MKRKAADFEVHVSDERGLLLETGGGLMKAKPLLGDAPFLCVNTDNIWLYGPVNSIRLMASHWDAEKMDALMLLVPLARATCHAGQGDFHMDPLGRLSRRKHGRVAPFVWTGIQNTLPGSADRSAGRQLFHQRVLGPRDCRRALLWRGAFRAMV